MKWLFKLSDCISLHWVKQLQFSINSCPKFSSCYLGNWQIPLGYDTGIKVYNSAANKKVPLVLKSEKVATWYMCGPTVYDDSHIGHASCYVKFDIIRRIMEKYFGIKVSLVMGITDIDDKIIKESFKAGKSVFEVSKKFEQDFFEDMEAMEVSLPTVVSRVTDNIQCIISFCEALIEKKFAYVTDNGCVYFMVSKGVSSDILNQLPEESQTVIDPLKKDRRDFALWKASKANEPSWDSPWGKGRPGWHVECSAMASKIFGSDLDLHSGGYDLLFPHHSNEKSQSEAYHGCKQWGNYWLHAGLLQVDEKIKMSKSLKNTITIKQFLNEHHKNDFRFMCLQSSYRKNMLYSNETIISGKALHEKFHNFINESRSYIHQEVEIPNIDGEKLLSKLKSTRENVTLLFADDFNTSQALFQLTDLIDSVYESLQSTSQYEKNSLEALAACTDYINDILDSLGAIIISKKVLQRNFVKIIDAVIQYRTQIRLFAMCQIQIENKTALQYFENIYKSFYENYDLISNEDFYGITSKIVSDIDAMHKRTLEFALSSPLTMTVSIDQTKAERKRRSPCLVLCDQLRSSLLEHGIVVKIFISCSKVKSDKKSTSYEDIDIRHFPADRLCPDKINQILISTLGYYSFKP